MTILFICANNNLTKFVDEEIIINLSKDIFCPFSIAYQLALTLTKTQQEAEIQSIFEPIVFLDFSDVTNIWYSLESLGNTNLIKAKSLAARLAKFLKPNQKIGLIGNGYISEENLAFLWYLYQFNLIEINFYYENQLFVDYYQQVFKTLQEGLKEDFASINLKGKYTHNVTDQDFDLSLVLESNYFKFLADKKVINKDALVNHQQELMIIVPWHILSTGATDLALYALSLFISYEKNLDIKNKLRQIYQGFLLGLQKYELLITETDNNNVTKDTNNFYYIKGYANLIFNQVTTAEECFNLAEINESLPVKSHYDLYKLNILSLLEFKKNQVENALKIQKKIKDYQESSPQLYKLNIHYTNELNLGRLNRYLKNYDLALRHFQFGFKQLEGVMQTGDYLYYFLLIAEIYELKQDFKKSFLYWTLSALAWSSLPCKNAVNWRILIALFKKEFNFNNSVYSSSITRIFIKKITFFLEQGYCKTHELNQVFNIRLMSDNQDTPEGKYYHSDLFNFVGVQENSNFLDPFENSSIFQQLNKLLISVLIEQTECRNITDYNTLYINFDLENEVNISNKLQPINQSNYSCKSGETLNDAEIFISVHPALIFIKIIGIFPYAFYKRYLAPQIISFLENEIINQIVEYKILTIAKIKEQMPQISNQYLFEMQEKKLIKFLCFSKEYVV